MNAWTEFAVNIADTSGVPSPMLTSHLENLAECALGPTRKLDGVENRPFHLEHVATYDVPLLIREIVRLRKLVAETCEGDCCPAKKCRAGLEGGPSCG